MPFLPFVYGYPSSSPHAHCTPNKSVPTLRYTHRHGPIYTGPCLKALTECSPLDFRRSSIELVDLVRSRLRDLKKTLMADAHRVRETWCGRQQQVIWRAHRVFWCWSDHHFAHLTWMQKLLVLYTHLFHMFECRMQV